MSMSSPAAVFTCHVEVRWSDQDLNGHVNNARVITLLEEARLAASRHWMGGVAEPRVIRSMSVDFSRSVHYGSPLSARVWVTRLGTTSYTVHHQLIQDDHLCVTCEAVVVVLSSSGKPAPLPDELRAVLEQKLRPVD